MKKPILLCILMLALSLLTFAATVVNKTQVFTNSKAAGHIDTATFASGCFWCGEAKFSQLKGVRK